VIGLSIGQRVTQGDPVKRGVVGELEVGVLFDGSHLGAELRVGRRGVECLGAVPMADDDELEPESAEIARCIL